MNTILALIILVPILEIYCFIKIGSEIGAISTVLLIFIDAGVIDFEVKSSWVDLLQLVLITVIGAYFGGRSFEKIKK